MDIKKTILSIFPYSLYFSTVGKLRSIISDLSPKEATLAIVAIAKNESDYIREWVAFHKAVGVDNIILFDNDSTDNMKEKIDPFIQQGYVFYHTINGKAQQLNAYNEALRRYTYKFRYMAFIDCDEYLFPVNKNDNIVTVIKKAFSQDKNAGGIGVNWAMYGSSGHETKPQGLCIENFVWRAKTPGGKGVNVIKTICKPDLVVQFNHTHYPVYKWGNYCISIDGKRIPQWRNEITDYTGLRINHYFTKSKEQWIIRRQMGTSDGSSNRTLEEFYNHNNNDIKDPSALYYREQVLSILNQL